MSFLKNIYIVVTRMSHPTIDSDKSTDDDSIHHSIPTLGDERINFDFPDFEEKLVDLPTLEELDQELREASSTTSIIDFTGTFQPNQLNQSKATAQSLHTPKMTLSDKKMGYNDDIEEIENLTLEISKVLAKRK